MRAEPDGSGRQTLSVARVVLVPDHEGLAVLSERDARERLPSLLARVVGHKVAPVEYRHLVLGRSVPDHDLVVGVVVVAVLGVALDIPGSCSLPIGAEHEVFGSDIVVSQVGLAAGHGNPSIE